MIVFSLFWYAPINQWTPVSSIKTTCDYYNFSTGNCSEEKTRCRIEDLPSVPNPDLNEVCSNQIAYLKYNICYPFQKSIWTKQTQHYTNPKYMPRNTTSNACFICSHRIFYIVLQLSGVWLSRYQSRVAHVRHNMAVELQVRPSGQIVLSQAGSRCVRKRGRGSSRW